MRSSTFVTNIRIARLFFGVRAFVRFPVDFVNNFRRRVMVKVQPETDYRIQTSLCLTSDYRNQIFLRLYRPGSAVFLACPPKVSRTQRATF